MNPMELFEKLDKCIAALGEEKVARLRLERDIAKDSYYVCLNAIDNLRLEIECIRSRITWERVELKNS